MSELLNNADHRKAILRDLLPVRVTGSTNASAMLEAGEHPILAVLDSL